MAKWRRVRILSAVLCALLLSVAMPRVVVAATAAVANWRFGRVQITKLDGGRIRLYMSLQNRGAPSSEVVRLYIGLPQAQIPSGGPVLLITDRTDWHHSTLVDATIKLPAGMKANSPNGYRLFLEVARTITDMMPVKKGTPVPGDTERKKFQK